MYVCSHALSPLFTTGIIILLLYEKIYYFQAA